MGTVPSWSTGTVLSTHWGGPRGRFLRPISPWLALEIVPWPGHGDGSFGSLPHGWPSKQFPRPIAHGRPWKQFLRPIAHRRLWKQFLRPVAPLIRTPCYNSCAVYCFSTKCVLYLIKTALYTLIKTGWTVRDLFSRAALLLPRLPYTRRKGGTAICCST